MIRRLAIGIAAAAFLLLMLFLGMYVGLHLI